MLRVLIIDDEAAARSRLRKLLGEIPDVEVIGEAANGLEALEKTRELSPDAIFLDVQMPGMSGLEVLQSLPATGKPPLVVFATAFDQYALAAFDANAVAYLLKPVNRDRLTAAVDRARRLVTGTEHAELDRARHAAAAVLPELQQLVGRRRDRFVLIPLDQVFAVFVEDELVKFRTESEIFWTDYQLNTLETRLPPPFFRARRSIIVNMQKVREIVPAARSSYMLILSNSEKTEIQVSERQSKRLRELLQTGS